MLNWVVFFIVYFILTLKQHIFWLFLWQNREYRGDKMLDYLHLPESRPVVLDRFSKLRIIVLALLVLFIFLPKNSVLGYLNLGVLSLVTIIEIGFFIKKVASKTLKKPGRSAKMLLIGSLSFVFSIALPILFFNFRSYEWSINLTSLIWLGFWAQFFLFITPLTLGYWILFFYPIDYAIKYRMFEKAKTYRQNMVDLKSVAISGAYGKTTTKEILDQVLSSKYKVDKTLKNQNSNVSCARRTLQLAKDTEFFLCELGSYKRGDGNEISRFILPNISIITGLNLQHFSLFGSEENIILTESESIHFLPKGSPVIVNWSSPMCRKIDFPNDLNVIKCGIDTYLNDEKVEYLAKNVVTDIDKTSFELVVNDKLMGKIETNLISEGVIQNILHIIAFCLELKLYDLKELKEIFENLESISGRMEVSEKDWGKMIYNQYNNQDGLSNIFKFIQTNSNKSQKIIFLDDIAELGSKSEEIHLQITENLLEIKPDKVVLLGRNYSNIVYNKLLQSGFAEKNIYRWDNKNTKLIKEQIRIELNKNKSNIVALLGYQSKNFLDL